MWLVPVAWSRPKSHFTLYFEAWAMRLMAEMPVNAAARELREHDTRLWRIFRHYVNKVMTELELSLLEGIHGLVQVSKRKARGYRNVNHLIAVVYMIANKTRLSALAARRS
ncbi:helix-turn-helix domain-containing protein [Paenibacillus sinopodophylli]|uniref:helix-turn-helix domain-containing protein n=1 Tax=Paenibacillus sinopodophylli TaxID=1837342 RepID=UPI002482A59B|nr:helix-turn-helix domain-containing protein [Paenibacillus sinopodophylli]